MRPADRSFLLRFLQVPPSLERELRTATRRAGAVSTVLAVLTGALVLALWGTANFVLVVEGLTALALLVSGSVLLTAPSHLARGHLNLALAEQTGRLTLLCWILTIVLAVPALIGVLVRSTSAVGSSPAALIVVLLLAVLAPVSAGFGHFGTRGLLPPTYGVLQRHHANGRAPGAIPSGAVEFPDSVNLPEREARRSRKAATRLGGVSTALSGTIAIALPVLAYWLPTGPYSFASSAVPYAVMAAMMALCSAILVWTGRGCVTACRLDVPSSTVKRRVLLTPLVFTVIMASSCYAMLTVNAAPPAASGGWNEHSAAAVAAFTALPFVAVVLAGVNYFAGRALFPSPVTLLRRFGPPPHWPRQ
ncbi:hypothetical protein [Actinopolyspora saharensis]|uniref:Uncharacterized protein n=1 Tax=Actinopolyspora saharensis TaxID=995062 RepID=A0A1H1F123_9ACTN|nr:hypothetical protein [Actinopolyspora saharensis]SDQ94663.1 hypothetical protein SAMN04489718_2782 [Actinopolyspora saharensis]